MADHSRKSELSAALARARAELTIHTRAVRRELDVMAHLKSSFRRHGLVWLAGAALLGLLLAKFPRRKKPALHPWRKPAPEAKAVKAGLLLTALKIAFDIFRPALMRWITQRVTEYSGGKPRDRGGR